MGDNQKQKIPASGRDRWEKCVLCNCITDVELCMPVSSREGYIEGAGQLCRECFRMIYGRAAGEYTWAK